MTVAYPWAMYIYTPFNLTPHFSSLNSSFGIMCPVFDGGASIAWISPIQTQSQVLYKGMNRHDKGHTSFLFCHGTLISYFIFLTRSTSSFHNVFVFYSSLKAIGWAQHSVCRKISNVRSEHLCSDSLSWEGAWTDIAIMCFVRQPPFKH